jgi:dihydroorotate dehydrogenase electron transfer subunit
MQDIIFSVEDISLQASSIYRLVLRSQQKLPSIICGQFLHLEVPDSSLLLRRPFCIYDATDFTVTTYFALVGKGTESLKNVKTGDKLKCILPLGNGFDINKYQNIGLLGGGMGCAELYFATKDKNKNFYAYFGFANKEKVLFENDFRSTCKKLSICTDDGSYGTKGYPIDELKKDLDILDAVLVCGPSGLVRSAAKFFLSHKKDVFVSMEQRMGCGVGACLVCATKISSDDGIHSKRVCMDGPVFPLQDIVFD